MLNYEGLKIQWLGHASFKIDNEITIYIDPFHIEREDTADLVLITHEHYDHCSSEDLDKVCGKETIIIAPSSCDPSIGRDFRKVKPGDRVEIRGIIIDVVPAYNMGKKFHPKGKGVGYVLTMNGVHIYHAGDTDVIPEMEKIRADIALLPVGGTYTMNAEEAAQATDMIKPKIAVPMHYGSTIGGTEDAEEFKEKCSCEVKILGKGE
ncbi:MBL fold metallo-hydrolase [Candidatus Woesearchaeota archaeon]|nr:MBL fold metallo-hydrolase [Candidatus Woesearchaeota archaeon]